ncbi:MAG: hypothetical protein SF187_08900 [Deltaproteobacteria bacterium]|nr:hypothetical protein [Deltaproteobacteria bacterium]
MASRKLRKGLMLVAGAAVVGVVLVVAGIVSRQLFEQPRKTSGLVAPRPRSLAKPRTDDDRFRVAGVQGTVEFLQDQKLYVLQAGDLLSLSDVIRTGPGARVLLRRKGSELEVRENLEIQLQSIADKQAEFSILRGSGDMTATVEDSEAIVKIRSDQTQATNQGPSRWVVARTEAGQVAVAVSAGSVEFAGRGRSVTVKAGSESVARANGAPTDPVQTPEDLLLDVVWPETTETLHTTKVEGKAGATTKVLINGKRVLVDADGRFSADLPLQVGRNAVDVEARDLQGRTKKVSQTITRTPKAPALESAKEDLWAP